MKFIRDIISERRGQVPAPAALQPDPAGPLVLGTPVVMPEPTAAPLRMDGVPNVFGAPVAEEEDAPAGPLGFAAAVEDEAADTGLRLFPEEGLTDLDDSAAPGAWDEPGLQPPVAPMEAVFGTARARPAEAGAEPMPWLTQEPAPELRASAEPASVFRPGLRPMAPPPAAPQPVVPAYRTDPDTPRGRAGRLDTDPRPSVFAAERSPALTDMPYVNVEAGGVETAPGFEAPPPAAGRGAVRSGRVKTRLLGFNPEGLGLSDPMERPEARPQDLFPVGWLVVVAGPGRGHAFPLHDGVSRIGRGEDQTISLNFGDNSISRDNHISIAFDSERSAFYVGQSGRANIVRLNNQPLLSTERMKSGDLIRVGETTLRLVALCGEDFSWTAAS